MKKISLITIIAVLLSAAAYGKTVETYYSNGYTRNKGEVDQDGKKTGRWQLWYNQGSPMAEGIYKDDKRHGKWIFMNKKGEVIAIRIFNNGKEVEKKTDPETLRKENLALIARAKLPQNASLESSLPKNGTSEELPSDKPRKIKELPTISAHVKSEAKFPEKIARFPRKYEEKTIKKTPASLVRKKEPEKKTLTMAAALKDVTFEAGFWRDEKADPGKAIFGGR